MSLRMHWKTVWMPKCVCFWNNLGRPTDRTKTFSNLNWTGKEMKRCASSKATLFITGLNLNQRFAQMILDCQPIFGSDLGRKRTIARHRIFLRAITPQLLFLQHISVAPNRRSFNCKHLCLHSSEPVERHTRSAVSYSMTYLTLNCLWKAETNNHPKIIKALITFGYKSDSCYEGCNECDSFSEGELLSKFPSMALSIGWPLGLRCLTKHVLSTEHSHMLRAWTLRSHRNRTSGCFGMLVRAQSRTRDWCLKAMILFFQQMDKMFSRCLTFLAKSDFGRSVRTVSTELTKQLLILSTEPIYPAISSEIVQHVCWRSQTFCQLWGSAAYRWQHFWMHRNKWQTLQLHAKWVKMAAKVAVSKLW